MRMRVTSFSRKTRVWINLHRNSQPWRPRPLQGHASQGVREQNYIRRPLDLLRVWHVKIEAWMLTQAGMAPNTS